jgi:hypothetical protein
MKALIGIIKLLTSAIFIRRSGLFYHVYYRSQYYQEIKAGRYLLWLSPVLHYVCFGTHENRNPNPFFDTEYYLENNPDVVESGQNPLVHYILKGAVQRRNSSPFFDTGYYLDNNPDVAPSGLNPLLHYLVHGTKVGSSPNSLFEGLRNFDEPVAAERAEGSDWLRQGLGVSLARRSDRPNCPDHMIRFEWDKGGWNNIRMQAEVLVCMAARFNRALVLPNSGTWYQVPGDTTHLFDYFDEAAFRAAVPVLPSDTRVQDEWEVPAHLSVTNTFRVKSDEFQRQGDRESWYFPRATRMFGCFASVFGSDSELYALVHRAFRLRADLLDKTIDMLHEHELKPGGYLAIHVRRGDFQYKTMRYLPVSEVIDALRRNDADSVGKLLIVSDQYDEELLESCRRQGWEAVCWATRHTDDEKLSGVLDMLCCCLAWRFVGTRLSTFSTGIIQWRGYVSRVVGARVDAVPRFTAELNQVPWWAVVDEHTWLAI